MEPIKDKFFPQNVAAPNQQKRGLIINSTPKDHGWIPMVNANGEKINKNNIHAEVFQVGDVNGGIVWRAILVDNGIYKFAEDFISLSMGKETCEEYINNK